MSSVMSSSMNMKPSFTLTLDTSIIQRRLFSYSFDNNAVTPNVIVLGVFMPNVFLFLQLATILFLQACICSLVAIFTYFTIVKQGQNSTVALLSGYGIVIPTLLYMPFWFIPFFQIQNTCFIFAVLTTPILTVFRCLEAMYGTCPLYTQKSLSSFIGYYAWAVPLERDASTQQVIRLSWTHIQERSILYLRSTLVGGLCYSILYPTSFQLFPLALDVSNTYSSSSSSSSLPWTLISHLIQLLHWKHILNNFVLAFLLFNNLLVSSSSIGLVTSFLSGGNTISLMKNPLFSSSSPSNFWAGRWNLIVHGLLKRGVYIPIRKNFPKAWFVPTLGVMMTFLASGLIHEYVVYVFLSLKCKCLDGAVIGSSYNIDVPNCCYPPVLGNALFFFLWNGILVYTERCLKPIEFLQHFANALPPFIITVLVIMTALPIAHWFTDPYRHAHFFHDAVFLFPVILRL